MGYKQRKTRTVADNPPGETQRRRKHGAIGSTSPTSHATNPKSRKKSRDGQRALDNMRIE